MYKARLLLYERTKLFCEARDIIMVNDKIVQVVFPHNILEENSYKIEEFAQEKSGADERVKLGGDEWNGVLERKIEISAKNYFEVCITKERIESGSQEARNYPDMFFDVQATEEENPKYISLEELNSEDDEDGEDELVETKMKIQRPVFGIIHGGKFKS